MKTYSRKGKEPIEEEEENFEEEGEEEEVHEEEEDDENLNFGGQLDDSLDKQSEWDHVSFIWFLVMF